MKKKYELVGFVNLLNIRPGFVYPIFKNNGRYYFQHGEDNRICEFEEINKKEVISSIIPLDDVKTPSITIESKPIYAYQRMDKSIYYGKDSDMKEYINKTVRTKSDNLQKEINCFMQSIDQKDTVGRGKGTYVVHTSCIPIDINIKREYPDWAERYRFVLVPMRVACDDNQDNPEVQKLQQKQNRNKVMILGLKFTEEEKEKIEHDAPKELAFISVDEDRLTTKNRILIMIKCRNDDSSDFISGIARYAMKTALYKMRTMKMKGKTIALIVNGESVLFSVDSYLSQKQMDFLIDEVIQQLML